MDAREEICDANNLYLTIVSKNKMVLVKQILHLVKQILQGKFNFIQIICQIYGLRSIYK